MQAGFKFAILDKTPPKVEAFLHPMTRILDFFKEVQVELSKVVWPTREQTIKLTLMVILVTIAVGVFVSGVDFVLAKLTSFIYAK